MNRDNAFSLLLSILVCHLAGLIGSALTADAIRSWYVLLNKPFWTPPNWLFGPVWLALYTIMGVALYLVWQQRRRAKNRIIVFLVHLALNASWSIVFFYARQIFLALIIIVVMIAMVLYLIFSFYKINRVAGLLLVPYILWLLYAASLNVAIWQYN